MQTKLFLGIKISSELKAQIEGHFFDPLQSIIKDGREYLGLYLDKPCPTVADIRRHADHFFDTLQQLFPDHYLGNTPVVLFPQFFLG